VAAPIADDELLTSDSHDILFGYLPSERRLYTDNGNDDFTKTPVWDAHSCCFQHARVCIQRILNGDRILRE
jgi:hypothetical protein